MLYLADRQKSKYSPKYPDFVLLVMDALKQILTMYVVHFLVLFSYLCFFGRHSRSNARGKYTFANAYGHSRWRLSWHSKCCAYLLRSWCVKLPLHYNCCRNRIYARYVLIAFQLVCTGQVSLSRLVINLLDPFLPPKMLGEFANNMFTITCVYYACSVLYSDQRFVVKWETLLERESEKMSTIQAQRWSLRLVKNYFQVNRKPDNQ